MGAACHLQQQEASHQTHGTLHQIAGDAGCGTDALAQQQSGVAEVARHHDDLGDDAADQRARAVLAERLEDESR